MDEALALRTRLKALVAEAAAPSLNDFVIKACALALRRHPRANGSFLDAGLELHDQINVGFAVASEDALVVPRSWKRTRSPSARSRRTPAGLSLACARVRSHPPS